MFEIVLPVIVVTLNKQSIKVAERGEVKGPLESRYPPRVAESTPDFWIETEKKNGHFKLHKGFPCI